MHAGVEPRLFTRAEFMALARTGVFDDERVELLYGTISRMTPINEPHARSVDALTRLLIIALDQRAHVRCQGPFAASSDSLPQPDLALFPLDDYSREHPSEAWLVIEVSDASLKTDRDVKGPLYAEVGVPEYWIVNIPQRCIEVYRDPKNGAYTSKSIHARGDTVTLLEFPDVMIAVSDVIR